MIKLQTKLKLLKSIFQKAVGILLVVQNVQVHFRLSQQPFIYESLKKQNSLFYMVCIMQKVSPTVVPWNTSRRLVEFQVEFHHKI